MYRAPLWAPHRSTLTLTSWAGRKPAGRVKATTPVPDEMEPSRWTTPEMVRAAGPAVPYPPQVQPFWRVSGVNELADVANETGRLHDLNVRLALPRLAARGSGPPVGVR